MQERAYSYAELRERFNVTTRTLRNWRAAGRLKPAVAANGKRVTRLVIVSDDAADAADALRRDEARAISRSIAHA